MRGIQLRSMGRYPVSCRACAETVALSWHERREAIADRLSHDCTKRGRAGLVKAPPSETDTPPRGRLVALTD